MGIEPIELLLGRKPKPVGFGEEIRNHARAERGHLDRSLTDLAAKFLGHATNDLGKRLTGLATEAAQAVVCDEVN